MGQEEYQELSSFLRRFIRRLKLIQGVEGLCLTAICALLLFALGPGVFQLKDFFPYAPLAYSILTALVLLGVIGWTLYRFLGRLTQERAALYIEQKQPKLRNNLINSLQLYPQVVEAKNTPGFSASMVLALLRTTRKQVAGAEDRRPARHPAIEIQPALARPDFSCRWWRWCCSTLPGSATRSAC